MTDLNEDPLYEQCTAHIARMLYTAGSLRATPDGFPATVLGEMADEICDELRALWRIIGIEDKAIEEASMTASVEANAGLARNWKPYESE